MVVVVVRTSNSTCAVDASYVCIVKLAKMVFSISSKPSTYLVGSTSARNALLRKLFFSLCSPFA